MALIPGGTKPRFGGGAAPAPVTPAPVASSNGSGSGGSDDLKDRLKSVVSNGNAPEPAPAEPAKTGGLAAFLEAEMHMPEDEDDADFDDELLRLSHKIHTVLVDELGGQQFKADDRERLRPVAGQVMADVLKDEKPLMPKRKAVLLEEVLNEVLGFGPMQYLPQRPDDLGNHGQLADRYFHRAQRQNLPLQTKIRR